MKSTVSFVWACVLGLLLVGVGGVWCQDSDGFFENEVEGSIKDIFSKELSSANNQNLTDCMTRLLCENICARAAKGEIKGEPLMNSAEMLGSTETEQLGYFFTGGDRGYEFGQRKECHQCANRYPNCQPSQYDTAKTLSGNFEQNMLKTAESSIDNEFMQL